ncbi:GAF domain-containing protein [Gemmatirosa kalamazoonensis]|uniref:GAF domain-containing protein n=1 Tax=Gemmatirosa kalamazoonensis TaxID=861299 RepID=UPI00046CA26C|nr:GAF domain-containing protein [Gemmatirosa kalamazoonensis]
MPFTRRSFDSPHSASGDGVTRLARTPAARTKALQRLSAALARPLARDAVADVVVSQLVPALGAHTGAVVELSPDGQASFPDAVPLPARDVVRTREPVYVESLAGWTARYAQAPGVLPSGVTDGAWCVLPLRVDEVVLGALTITFPAPRAFTSEERAFMQAFADQCAQALDRARLSEAERRARALSEMVLASIEDGFLAVDRAYRFTYLNARAESMLGKPASMLIGRAASDVYPALAETRFSRAIWAAIRDGRSSTVEEYAASVGAWVEARIAPIDDGATIVFRDVTERRRAEAADRLLGTASAAIARSLDVDETAAAVARAALPTLADWAMVDLLADDDTLRRVAAVHVEPDRMEAAREVVRWPSEPTWAYGAPAVVRSGEPQVATEIPTPLAAALARVPERRAALEALGLRSYLCVPLRARGRTLGALTLVRGDGAPGYTHADLPLAGELAARAALALDNAQLHTAERAARAAAERAAERTRQLQALTAALGSALTNDAVAHVVLHHGIPAFGADAGVVTRLHADGVTLSLLAQAGFPDDTVAHWRRYTVTSGSPGGRVVTTGEPVLLEDLEAVRRAFPAFVPVMEAGRYEAIVALPLRVDARTLGMIAFAWRAPHVVSDDERAQLVAFAAQCAQAKERARLFESSGEARAAAVAEAARVRELQTLTAALTGAVRPEDVAAVALERARPAFGAAGGLFNLLSDDDREFVQLGAAGLSSEFMRPWRRYPIDRGTAGSEVVRTGAPVFVRSMDEARERFPVLVPAMAHHGFPAFAALPLHAGRRLLGLVVFNFTEPRPFTEAEREHMRAFAGQCALALARANLYEAERHEREKAERLSRRLRVLADAGRTLAAPLDVRGTLAAIAKLAVPTFADGCAVDLLYAAGAFERAVNVHVDPAKAALIAASARANLDVRQRVEPETFQRLLDGHGVLVPDLTPERLAAHVPNEAQRAAISGVGIRSYMLAPLVVANTTLGALSFMITESDRQYDADDLALAEELARRSAVALENARLYEAERVARAEAEAANRAKMDFLATMSHELRTPLNAIGGHAQLLELGIHGPLTDAQSEALARIQASQSHLLGLINDVLNFAKLDAGKVEFHPVAVSLHDAVCAVAALVEPQFDAKGIRHAHAGCDATLVVRADADKLRQILLNLLSNAAKYTPAHGEVVIRCARDGEGALVEVRDTGIGIPSEKIEHIFEPFVQLGRSLSTNLEGTGLGLAISRDLARGMGGDLTVVSAPGVGSTFTLALPLA